MLFRNSPEAVMRFGWSHDPRDNSLVTLTGVHAGGLGNDQRTRLWSETLPERSPLRLQLPTLVSPQHVHYYGRPV